jgi:hypothetical protein
VPLHPMKHEFVMICRETAHMGEGDTMETLMRAGVHASLVRASGCRGGWQWQWRAAERRAPHGRVCESGHYAHSRYYVLGFRERQNDVFRALAGVGVTL